MKTRLCLLLLVGAVPVSASAQPRILWEDDAPFNMDSVAGVGGSAFPEFFVASEMDPLSSGRGEVARINLTAEAFVNVHDQQVEGVVTQFPITSDDYGLPFRFSMDYLIPTDTNMDVQDVPTPENPDQISPDQFWVQVDFNGANEPDTRAGFIGTHNIEDIGGALGEWQTFVFEAVVPADRGGLATTFVTPLIIWTDNGFSGGVPNGNGVDVSMYIDNILLEIIEPTAGLLGDSNGDGEINTLDIDPFVLALTDPGTYQTNFPEVDFLGNNDINMDGMVNTLDIDAFVALLTGGAAVATPEPSAMALALVAAVGVLRRRR